MMVYGDRCRTVAPQSLILDIGQCLIAANAAVGLERLDLLMRSLIGAGELAQGVADAEFDAVGEDGCSPVAAATMAFATAVAGELLAAAGEPQTAQAGLADSRAALEPLPLPPRIRCRTPEGYGFYALYPEDYAAAAARTDAVSPLVIGLRSIGTSLAATVAARLGCAALTVRPCGHPFRRHLRVSSALKQRLTRHAGQFVIVDEGPGLSGGSFGAAADLLEDLGVPLARMLFLTGHANELGPRASPSHRARWTRSRRTAAASDVSPSAIEAWFADLVGPVTRTEDLSGGAWRHDRPENEWPPAAPAAERRKFRLTGPGGRFVARFAGLGAAGEEKLLVARLLHGARLAPKPLALRRGFLLERWQEGRPLAPAEMRSEAFLRHLGRYLGFRARALPADGNEGASLAELCQMACVNAAELGGPELGLLVEARLSEAGKIPDIEPVRTDGRLHGWEWLRLPDGGFLKTDALDHAVSHDLVGCQDIAWDVAGAAVEFDLPETDIEALRVAVGEAAGRDVSRPAVAAFRICYAVFQGGLWTMMGETNSFGSDRVAGLCRKYLAALRRTVAVGGEPDAAGRGGADASRRTGGRALAMTAPRRIGVLTFHRCINYGSYWQARCLVEGLRRRGLDAVLLDYRSERVDRAEWRCALNPHRPAPTRATDRAAYARKTRRFLVACAALPLSRPFSLERPDGADDCDLVLVGSDEVWNLRHPWYGAHRLFYGVGLADRRLAAYAASFGNQPAAAGLDPCLGDLLRRFEAISVRDDNSRQIVRESLGHEIELVLDPCLQFPEVARRQRPSPRGDYAVVYGHSFPDWLKAGVSGWARRKGLRLVSLGYRNDWADEQWLDAGPEDFPNCISAAAAVATIFFHGCIFALLHNRPFVCAASDYRANKVRSLMSVLDAQRHLATELTPAADYHAALGTEPDASVAARIGELRARSDTYLDHVLQ